MSAGQQSSRGSCLGAARLSPGIVWRKGIFGTNKKCARDTVRALLDDVRLGRLSDSTALDRDEAGARIASRVPDRVTYEDWRRLDRHERSAGASTGRPRVKMNRVEQMLQHLKT
ncbi:hypothetical protein MCHIJ_36550 [Mycolicibacterium chitae]|uniref:hypothetical protein n=1 Tax=Mycolicibacterium TaxID=1866885 RepID=UPI00138C28FC|nr:hypothetical protein [Mycolicibacterium chitae]BBZ04218.1 hypothetical protein MCHIJ_36550 [Mycolicibacterium chitae]